VVVELYYNASQKFLKFICATFVGMRYSSIARRRINNLHILQQPEKSRYKPPNTVDFICSNCTLMLAGMGSDSLKAAYAKSITEKAPGKKSALESFLPRAYRQKG